MMGFLRFITYPIKYILLCLNSRDVKNNKIEENNYINENGVFDKEDGVEIVQKLPNNVDRRSSYVILEDKGRLNDLDLICYDLDLKIQSLEETYKSMSEDLEKAKEEFKQYIKMIKILEEKTKILEDNYVKKINHIRFKPYNLRSRKNKF
jgi:hypothetical protein